MITVSDIDGTLELNEWDDDDAWDGEIIGGGDEWMLISGTEIRTLSMITGIGKGRMFLLKISGGYYTVISWKG